MMRIIRYFLLSLVCSFSLCAKADTNVNYTAQLAQIYSVLNILAQDQQSIQDLVLFVAESVDHPINTALQGGHLPGNTYWTNLGNAIIRMRDSIDNIGSHVTLINSLVDQFLSNISYDTLQIYNSLTQNTNPLLLQMQESLASLDTFGDSLQDIIDALNNAASSVADVAMNQDLLNREATQQEILDALEEIRGRITVFPEEDIHTLVSIGNDILQHLSEALRLMTQWKDIFNFWDQFYYRQFNGMGNFTLDYYRLLDAPYFSTGYDPQQQTVDYDPGNFVQSLYALLRGHLKLLESINDGILFLGKSLSTNAQSQVEDDFQHQKEDIAQSLDTDYQQLRSYTYRGISYNLRDTKLYDVSTFISSFESSQYDAVKVHNVVISGFEVFGNLPTYFDFRYDLTPIASYLELVRNVFTVFWVLFFASFWIFLVSLFYRFYHFLYRLLCMVPGQSAPPPGPGLPVPSGG